MDLFEFRKEYSGRGLGREEIHPDPIEQFSRWFTQAVELAIHEPNAMTLATATPQGAPSQRTVLLKHFDRDGFVFFSNYASRKGVEIDANPQASLLFPWIVLERQIIVEGRVEKVSREDSLHYFHSRPRDSQIGAWVSQQSAVIPSRAFLLEKLAEVSAAYAEGDIPLPPEWGGYRVVPHTIEFWQGGPARLHDRFRFTRHEQDWKLERLSP